MIDDGTLVYFEYDPSEDDFTKRVGKSSGKLSTVFSDHLPNNVLDYHFNYTDGSFLFLDTSRKLFKIMPNLVKPEPLTTPEGEIIIDDPKTTVNITI